jgi:hypothetical protein
MIFCGTVAINAQNCLLVKRKGIKRALVPNQQIVATVSGLSLSTILRNDL